MIATAYTLAEARLRCAKSNHVPYLYQGIASLVPVERPGLGTFAVDEWMRMYYDPAMLEVWSLDTTTQVIVHEYLHVWLAHFRRARAIYGEQPTAQQQHVMNLAADLVVNQVLQSVWPNLDAGEFLLPAAFGLPVDQTMEWYYGKLNQRAQQLEQGQQGDPQPGDDMLSDGTSGPSKPGRGNASGAADGCHHGYELDKPGGAVPGMLEVERELVNRAVAQRVDADSRVKQAGTMSGYLARAAESLLRPKVNPFAELQAAVRHASLVSRGSGDYTWRRVPRRVPAGGCRLPASVKPVPRVVVAVDTSGSMGPVDLAQALVVVDLGLKHVPAAGMRVLSGDTEAKSVQTVFSAHKVELLGGGGTDMRRLLEQAARERPAPDAIILVTDGYTPWPSREIGPRVVACITATGTIQGIPDWIRVVQLEQTSN